jgi:hypothetical protein
MSDEEATQFQREPEQALGKPYRILPQAPPLTPEQVRYLLRECVTIVKPGETLIVRVPWTTKPSQLYEYQRVIDSREGGEIPFKVLVVAGDELGTVQDEPDFMARVHVEHLHGTEHLKVRLTHEPSGITVAARDRQEAIIKLRHALTGAASRQASLQAAERRAQEKTAKATEGTPAVLQPRVRAYPDFLQHTHRHQHEQSVTSEP